MSGKVNICAKLHFKETLLMKSLVINFCQRETKMFKGLGNLSYKERLRRCKYKTNLETREAEVIS